MIKPNQDFEYQLNPIIITPRFLSGAKRFLANLWHIPIVIHILKMTDLKLASSSVGNSWDTHPRVTPNDSPLQWWFLVVRPIHKPQHSWGGHRPAGGEILYIYIYLSLSLHRLHIYMFCFLLSLSLSTNTHIYIDIWYIKYIYMLLVVPHKAVVEVQK